jgi:hypothetical protein
MFHETDVSTQQSKEKPQIWLPGEDEDPRRADDFKAPPG